MMSDDNLILAQEFPTPTDEQWHALVDKVLKGASFDKVLRNKTYDNLTIEPLYTEAQAQQTLPGSAPYLRGSRPEGNVGTGWDIRQTHENPDITASNNAILQDLERGVTSINLAFNHAVCSGQDADQADEITARGLLASSADELDKLLTGVYLDLAPISTEAGANFLGVAAQLIALLKNRNTDLAKAQGCFNADPLGTLAREGQLPQGLDTALAQMSDLAAYTQQQLPKFKAITVDANIYHDAGASEAQMLAYSMATGVAYLRSMTAAGMAIDDACQQIRFNFAVGTDQFMSIAALRAARQLWARICQASGASAEASAMQMTATTGGREMSQRDPWVNLLRTSVSTFAAATAGADSITVRPFTDALGLPTSFARRIARNTQLVLMEESNLHAVIDPAGGSWYVENITQNVAETAWKLFQAVEAAGGMAACLQNGEIEQRLGETRAARNLDTAKRKFQLTGINEFPDINEAPVEVAEVDMAAVKQTALNTLSDLNGESAQAQLASLESTNSDSNGSLTTAAVDAALVGASAGRIFTHTASSATQIDALTTQRLGAEFEALRDASDRFLDATGKRPQIFLANIGTPADFTARTTFIKNFFEAGGVETIGSDALDSAEAAVAAFEASGASIACLCSSDKVYDAQGVAIADALTKAGSKKIYLAGKGGEQKAALEEAGVSEFIAMGCNVLDSLRATHTLLGVN